jgi:hypothetical protein
MLSSHVRPQTETHPRNNHLYFSTACSKITVKLTNQ